MMLRRQEMNSLQEEFGKDLQENDFCLKPFGIYIYRHAFKRVAIEFVVIGFSQKNKRA